MCCIEWLCLTEDGKIAAVHSGQACLWNDSKKQSYDQNGVAVRVQWEESVASPVTTVVESGATCAACASVASIMYLQ